MTMDRRVVLAAGLGLPLWPLQRARAAPWPPQGPVTLLCPWPAGGAMDSLFRVLAASVSGPLGTPVQVENRPGAGGTLEYQPQVQAGRLRNLAVLGSRRLPGLADVPTVAETGWNTVSNSPFGIGGPKGLDPALVKRLHDAFKQAVADPPVRQTMARLYLQVLYMDTAAYTRFAERSVLAEGVAMRRLGLAPA